VAPSALEGCHHVSILERVLGGNSRASVVRLWNVHGDKPIRLLGDGPHVGRVVFRQQNPDLAGQPLEEEEGEDRGSRLARRAKFQHLRQHHRRLAVAQWRQAHHPLHFLIIREGVGGQERSSEPLVGLGTGVVVKNVSHKADRVDRESRQHVIVPRDGVGDVAKGELPLS
jgi:hypothetical protein